MQHYLLVLFFSNNNNKQFIYSVGQKTAHFLFLQ